MVLGVESSSFQLDGTGILDEPELRLNSLFMQCTDVLATSKHPQDSEKSLETDSEEGLS